MRDKGSLSERELKHFINIVKCVNLYYAWSNNLRQTGNLSCQVMLSIRYRARAT